MSKHGPEHDALTRLVNDIMEWQDDDIDTCEVCGEPLPFGKPSVSLMVCHVDTGDAQWELEESARPRLVCYPTCVMPFVDGKMMYLRAKGSGE